MSHGSCRDCSSRLVRRSALDLQLTDLPRGDRPACVVLKQQSAADPALAELLKQHVKSLLAPYKYPRWIEFLPELPKTATGKIQRFKLRALDAQQLEATRSMSS